MPLATIEWIGDVDGHARIVDQTRLPREVHHLDIRTPTEMAEAIGRLAVRGAPAIGIAGAFGVVLALRDAAPADAEGFVRRVERAADLLAASRPTAVNLFWALDRMRRRAREAAAADPREARVLLLEEARRILEEDRRTCRALGRHGAPLVPEGGACLTHCNAGGLATADYGTALAVFFRAHEEGRRFRVYVDETRPLLQGARLTAWELRRAGIETVLICDDAAAWTMRRRDVRAVFVGADRIAANGDTANKIGTYGVALLARAHNVPFYVVAPTSTFDLTLAGGDEIPIEERDPSEVTEGFGVRTAPDGVAVFNPAFDVTPHHLVTAIVTEHGLIESPDSERVARFFEGRSASILEEGRR